MRCRIGSTSFRLRGTRIVVRSPPTFPVLIKLTDYKNVYVILYKKITKINRQKLQVYNVAIKTATKRKCVKTRLMAEHGWPRTI